MKKYLLIAASFLPLAANAQSATDAYTLAQPDMKGTARFMSMGGAFGALGGDLSTLSQNPAGIGVYRSNELGITLDLDCQNSSVKSGGASSSFDQSKFYLNNVGGVATFKLNSKACPNINVGFTYNKGASFDREYRGNVPQLRTSLSNYIAGLSNFNCISETDITGQKDPYNPGYNDRIVPWLTILGYDSFLISPDNYVTQHPVTGEDVVNTEWYGQFVNGQTSGRGKLNVHEKGGIEDFNIALGGNINNIVFWGMDFDIVSANYTCDSYWTESLQNAEVAGTNGVPAMTSADWSLYNYYNVNGTGFNYKLGVIIKPIQELRIGFAFHTPTWYNLTQSFYGSVDYAYGAGPDFSGKDQNGHPINLNPGYADTNDGYDGINSFNLRTPWKFMVSAAGVIGSKFILSADYEWSQMKNLHLSDSNDTWNDEERFGLVNGDIKDYYRISQTLRVGAEYRITNHLSARAGYSFVSSPVKPEAKEGTTEIWASGTRPAYVFDNTTNYFTLGLGYRYKAFYVDLAYVNKHYSASYCAFPPDTEDTSSASRAKIGLTNNQIVLSAGIKF